MSQMIQVTLLDGSHKEVAQGTTPLEIARSISPRLADAALVARIKPKQSAVSTHGTPGQAQQSATKQSGSGASSSWDRGRDMGSQRASQGRKRLAVWRPRKPLGK